MNQQWPGTPVGGQPVAPAQPAQPMRQEDPIIRRADPYKASAEARAQQDQQLQLEKFRAEQEKDRRAQIEWEAKFNPDGTLKKPDGGGRAISDGAVKRIEAAIGNFTSLNSSLSGFQDDYAGNTITGGLENTIQGAFDGFGTPGQRDWWAAFKQTDNVIRNELFGATLTPSEQKSYLDTTIDPSLSPKIVRENLERRTKILKTALERQRRFMIANGYNEEAVNILYEPIAALETLSGAAPNEQGEQGAMGGTMAQPPANGAPPAGSGPAPVSGPPSPEGQQINQSGFQNEDDPALAGVRDAYFQMLQQNLEPGQVVTRLRELGVTNPTVLQTAARQAEFRRRNPNVPLDTYDFEKVDDRMVPLSGFEKAASAVGGSPIGTYLMNAGQFLSGNTLDNLTSDPERARTAMEVANIQNPKSALTGHISGALLSSVAAEGLLGRAGMAPGLVRGLTADTLMGAANGAGAADQGNRLGGAAMGGAAAAAGNLAGNAIVRGASRVIAPTGGNMNSLYNAGVRPTIGQRFADSGTIGRAVNTVEQALQSVPVVGSSIRGARQEARDQFQLGAFNEALREVGEELPKGMRPGTDPHAYAQKTFDRVYAEARSAMTFRADDELAQDLGALSPEISTLGPQAQGKLKAIMENQVNKRVVNGEMDGQAFKRTVSDLGKHIARMRKSNNSEDQALADVLEGVKGAIEASARRHSDPAAVELLDAADAGYAKFVRIENAAARVGGDSGTFSPKAFDRAVQQESGGIRSKSYLRGDALMQDYAQAGKNLDDTLPNSGTSERIMAGYAVGAPAAGAAIYADPVSAAILGGIAAAYAPGVRKAMQRATIPAGPRAKAISDQLKKRARLISAASAASAVQGTSPGQ